MSIQTASLSWVRPTNGFDQSKLNSRIVQPTINSAIEKGLFKQVRYLIALGARVNQRDGHGRTSLMNVAMIKDARWGVGLARLLLEKGAKPHLRDAKGRNAMHYAVLYENIPLVEVYMSALDFNINEVDRNGNNVLHYSVACGNTTLTKKLMDAYKRYQINVNSKNSSGNTPILVACKMGQKGCANCLMECNVDIDICDKNGRSTIEWLASVNEDSGDEEQERSASVSSLHSMSTIAGTMSQAGRHSRVGMYTPLGGPRHSRRMFKNRRTPGRSMSRIDAYKRLVDTPCQGNKTRI